jgi:hypothetical protein
MTLKTIDRKGTMRQWDKVTEMFNMVMISENVDAFNNRDGWAIDSEETINRAKWHIKKMEKLFEAIRREQSYLDDLYHMRENVDGNG